MADNFIMMSSALLIAQYTAALAEPSNSDNDDYDDTSPPTYRPLIANKRKNWSEQSQDGVIQSALSIYAFYGLRSKSL